MSEEKKSTFAKFFGAVLSPMAAGAVEKVGGAVGEKVVGYLKNHFSSSEKLPQVISESYQKGLDTLEIALAGPKFYNKTANREFAKNFQEEVLHPFLQSQGFEEDIFLKGALSDLQILRSLSLTPEEALSWQRQWEVLRWRGWRILRRKRGNPPRVWYLFFGKRVLPLTISASFSSLEMC